MLIENTWDRASTDP